MRAHTLIVLLLSGLAGSFAAVDTTPPTTPADLRVTAITANTVTLAWNPSTDNSGAFTYQLADSHGFVAYPHQTVTSLTVTGLLPGRSYTYTIRAFDAARNYSGPSNPVTHTAPPDTTAPTAPTLSVAYLAPVRATVSWTRSTDDTSFSITYTVHANGVARSGDIRHNLGQTLLNLSPGTLYALQVSARDPYGNTSWSNTVTVTTPAITDTTPPSAPANLGGRADVGSCEAYLSWTQSADNADAQLRLLYRFRVGGVLSPVTSWVVGRHTNVGATVLEAPGEGTHQFTVEAVDGSGNVSAVSNAITLTHPGC